jgi:threonine dehydratase
METLAKTYHPELNDVRSALVKVHEIAEQTPLQKNVFYSEKYGANVHFKREDLQVVRSYKIRGAFNKISSLSLLEKNKGVVCASAGNHAQGVALSCSKLKIRGSIFMPLTTPKQKIEQVEMFGKEWIQIYLVGDTFDDAQYAANNFCKEKEATFVHPFDDEKVIEGQATIALEILSQSQDPIDYLFLPIGGGGVAAGVSEVFKLLSPNTKIIGVEPLGAPSMKTSISQNVNTRLDHIDKFIDGASVQKVGDLNFEICRKNLDHISLVDEGLVCSTILELYNKNAIVAEPAGALSISVLNEYQEEIKNKNVVCLVSGGNNDITRTEEIKEKALLYEKLKHYFIVRFPQRSGALKDFVLKVLGPNDDITYFEYNKKNSRIHGSAVVGIVIEQEEDFEPLLEKMKQFHFYDQYLNENENLLNFLV